jgi:hypothetical protein
MSNLFANTVRKLALRLLNHPAFWIVAALALSGELSRGTSIAIVRDDNEIVIAADSRAVDGRGNKLPDDCKIRQAGKWYFTQNGISSVGSFSAPAYIETILARGEHESLDQKTKAIASTLTEALNNVLLIDPSIQGSAMGISVFGDEDGSLKLAFLKFGFSNGSFRALEIHICPTDCPYSDNRAAVFVPSADTRQLDKTTPAETVVRAFVRMEIGKRHFDIGGPIQLLRITRFGKAHWIEEPSVCRNHK